MPRLPVSTRLARLLRPLGQKGMAHWVRLVLLLAAGFFVGHLLSEGDWLTTLRYALYQRQLRLQRPGEVYPQRTVLVLLEDEDFWGDDFARRAPVKRDRLAQLIDQLNTAGANTVVVDFDLRSPHPDDPTFDFADYRAEDAALIASVARMCSAGHHVVLSSSVRYAAGSEELYEQLPAIYSAQAAALPCLSTGYIELPFDMRTLPGPLPLASGGHLDSFALAVAKIADPVAYEHVTTDVGEKFRFSTFLTQADFAPRAGRRFLFSAQDVLRTDPTVLHPQVADRVVFIGAHWHQYAKGVGPRIDTADSPGGRMPGVMLHANYVEAILDRTGTFIALSDRAAEVLEGLLVIVLAIIGALEFHAFWKWSAFTVGLLCTILLTYTLLQSLGLFLDFVIPFVMIVVHTLVEEILCMREELHHARHALKQGAA